MNVLVEVRALRVERTKWGSTRWAVSAMVRVDGREIVIDDLKGQLCWHGGPFYNGEKRFFLEGSFKTIKDAFEREFGKEWLLVAGGVTGLLVFGIEKAVTEVPNILGLARAWGGDETFVLIGSPLSRWEPSKKLRKELERGKEGKRD